MKRRQQQQNDGTLGQLLSQTADLVDRLLQEHRSLRAQNERLTKEVERLSRGWEDVRRLARSAPRGRIAPARSRQRR